MADSSPKPYVVRSGDYLSALAFRSGTTVEAILALPKNAELKKKRQPEILAPGDIVYLPTPPEPATELTAETENDFTAEVPMVDVHLTLAGRDGKPLAAQELVATPAVLPSPLRCEGGGKVLFKVSINVRFVRLLAADTGEQFDVRVGHLDPHDERSGLLSRLRQLGYVGDEEHRLLGRPWLGEAGEDMAARNLALAVSAFQRARGLPVTGIADEAVYAAVRDEHGC